MARDAAARPPAIVMGGEANALSVARSLKAHGVTVYALTSPRARVRYSSACRWIQLPEAEGGPDAWESFLLGPASEPLRGAVLLSCSDEAMEVVIRRRAELAQKFVLEEDSDDLRLRLLNKFTTYRLAETAGIPTPRFWALRTLDELAAIGPELVFPLIVKPLFSHHVRPIWGLQKYRRADGPAELHEELRQVLGRGIEFLLMEFIPGPDSRLCSYYTYMDSAGTPLFHFTKRVIRRHPEGMGEGCYHITDRDPEVMELGLRFFRHAGLRGLGNIEFKRDPRDGRLKIIECNARFTAANCLVKSSGLDLAVLTYDQLTGAASLMPSHYRTNLTLWLPSQDVLAFLKLRRQGKITLWQWLASVARPQTFQFLSWRDPLPALVGAARRGRSLARRLLRRRAGAKAAATPRSGKCPS